MERIDPAGAKKSIAAKRDRLAVIDKEIAHTLAMNNHDLWKWPRERQRLNAEKTTLLREIAQLEGNPSDRMRPSSMAFFGSHQ